MGQSEHDPGAKGKPAWNHDSTVKRMTSRPAPLGTDPNF